jgi:hypothetical protein
MGRPGSKRRNWVCLRFDTLSRAGSVIRKSLRTGDGNCLFEGTPSTAAGASDPSAQKERTRAHA